MRTTIDIDDRLMRRALRLGGFATKKAAIEAGLRFLTETHGEVSIRGLRGKVRWQGDSTGDGSQNLRDYGRSKE